MLMVDNYTVFYISAMMRGHFWSNRGQGMGPKAPYPYETVIAEEIYVYPLAVNQNTHTRVLC